MTPRTFPHLLPGALAVACLLGLTACTPAGSDAAADVPVQDAISATAMPAPADPVPPTAAPGPAPDIGLVHWNGYGDTAFGMDETAFRKAWGGDLSSDEFEDKASCFHLWPKGQKTSAELAFMFGDARFARYSTEDPKLTAPGGGRIGMSRGEIGKLYPGHVEEEPHKYTDGKYLRIADGENVLVFETDGSGKVTEWRVGVPPYVDYVEGCA